MRRIIVAQYRTVQWWAISFPSYHSPDVQRTTLSVLYQAWINPMIVLSGWMQPRTCLAYQSQSFPSSSPPSHSYGCHYALLILAYPGQELSCKIRVAWFTLGLELHKCQACGTSSSNFCLPPLSLPFAFIYGLDCHPISISCIILSAGNYEVPSVFSPFRSLVIFQFCCRRGRSLQQAQPAKEIH